MLGLLPTQSKICITFAKGGRISWKRHSTFKVSRAQISTPGGVNPPVCNTIVTNYPFVLGLGLNVSQNTSPLDPH